MLAYFLKESMQGTNIREGFILIFLVTFTCASKCEVCKRPLEDLRAGDSIWIYRQTVHCEPCYSKVKGKMQDALH